MIRSKLLRKLIIITLCMVLVLVGCSSADKSEAMKTGDTGEKYSTSALPGGSGSTSTTDSVGTTSAPASVKEGSDTEAAYAPAIATESYSDSGSARDYSAMSGLIGEESISFKAEASGDAEIYISVADDYDTDCIEVDPIDPYEPILTPMPAQISAGMLTAGEWNDNKNFDFLKSLIADGQNYRYSDFFTNWSLSPFSRLVICCKCGDTPVQNAKVTVYDMNGNAIWAGVTDYEGNAYAYYALTDAASNPLPSSIKAEYNGSVKEQPVMKDDLRDPAVTYVEFDSIQQLPKTLDLMFTVDTTGSMGDEIYYLQKELENVIKRVQNDSENIPVRLSVNFYRDLGDEYVVRPYEFSTDINTQLAYLNKEYAAGGGDFEEAVEKALASSVNDHSWDENIIKLMFLVLDAPPHNTRENKEILLETITKASEMGIRIIPVASSGIDKDTEFLLRAFAMATGGTYTFLTDDSGIGGSHLEPTVGEYTVEHLNDLLVRLIEQYIG